MEDRKQCPHCGKYVSADRTYCLNCGTTLGVRCPACGRVAPVGSRSCPFCGQAMTAREKRVFPLWERVKGRAVPVFGTALALWAAFLLVASALPALRIGAGRDGAALPRASVSGCALFRYLLGARPAPVSALLKAAGDRAGALVACLSGGGLAFLLMGAGTLLSLLLVFVNIRRFGRATAKRLFAPLGVVLGGAVLLGGCAPAAASLLRRAAARGEAAGKAPASVRAALPIAVAAAAACLFALYLLLYLSALRRAEREGKGEELSLSRMVSIPLSRVSGALRAARERRRGRKPAAPAAEPPLSVTPRFTVYLVLLGVSLVFTQALLSKVSHLLFWFLFLLPLVSLLYALSARRFVRAEMISETVTVEKNAPYVYEFRLDNRSPLACPFVEAVVSLPQSDSVRCSERRVYLSLAPFRGYHMRQTVRFRFRGTYEIGVRGVYISDFFRLFRAYAPLRAMSVAYVLPRRLVGEETQRQAVSDSTARTVRVPLAIDRLEVGDIRDYRRGDPLKSVHWKLSSKSEDLVVKEYNTGSADTTVVYCDMAAHFPDEPPADPPAPEAEQAAKARPRKARLKQERKGRRRRLSDRKGRGKGRPAEPAVEAPTAPPDPRRLADPAFYADMNEYLADGVVELTIAAVLSELRQGREVILAWFDRRSDAGAFVFRFRGADGFENIYRLFATAPLCAASQRVTSLASVVGDVEGAKRLFVLPSLDAETLSGLCALPRALGAGDQGTTEALLYNPEDRFAFPKERAGYLADCRRQLAARGLSLTVSGAYLTREDGAIGEGGESL